MREILFRAKRKDNGEWVYGVPITQGNMAVMYFPAMVCVCEATVYINTIGQFTGLTDKNGTKIFENDIVTLFGEKYVVKWENNSCTYIIENSNIETKIIDETKIIEFSSDFYEIIGNTIDNPELLE